MRKVRWISFITAILFIANHAFGLTTFSPERFELFFDNFVHDQGKIVNATFHIAENTNGGSVSSPPPGMLGYAPLVITNNSGLSSSRLYLIGKGQQLAATDAYFLQPNLTTGVCTLVSSQTNNSADPTISVQLSQLPSAGTNSYYIYVPQIVSGRFYISVDYPLYMETLYNVSTGYYTINDPSQTTIQDPNYYTLYQDFEFTFDKNYDLYANVTNVDYFAVPMTLGSYTYPSGKPYPTLDNLTVVGYPTTSTRSQVLTDILNGLSSGDHSPTPQWSSLAIPFYNNPYTDSSPETYLRIGAAKTSIGLSQSTVTFKGAMVPQTYFSSTYLETIAATSTSGSYMAGLYDYYNTGGHQLQMTIFPSNNPTATYTMTASGTSGVLNLTSSSVGALSPITINLNNLTTSDLLSGAVGDWVADSVFTPNATQPWQTEIAKMLSALFTAGMLPPASSVTQPVVDNSTYFSSYRANYFSNPSIYTMNGPWYNLYDQVVHPLLIQTGGYGLGYAYDFDDLLDLAGLLHVNIQTSGQLNAYQPYCVLTTDSIDTAVPNPRGSFGPYTLEVYNATTGSNRIDIIYSTSSTEAPSTVYTVPTSGTPNPATLSSSAYNYFTVKYYNQSQSSYLEYNVYPRYQLVLPVTTRYNAQDVQLMNGIVFNTGTNATTAIITLPFTNFN